MYYENKQLDNGNICGRTAKVVTISTFDHFQIKTDHQSTMLGSF